MKKLLVAVCLALFASTPALAQGPDTVTLQAKNGNITFNHKQHSETLDCNTCHQGTPGKMELNKDSGHKLCLECHKSKSAGPTKCGECHKK